MRDSRTAVALKIVLSGAYKEVRMEAKFENGVLTVRVPKAAGEAVAKRRIDIK